MIYVELRKQSIRMRTYAILSMMIALPVLLTAIIKLGNVHDTGKDLMALAQQSGINMSIALLHQATRSVLLIVAALFAGSAICEESNWGSLRYLLLRPIPRNRILSSKLTVACSMALAATILVVVSGLIAGTVAFGWHPMQTPDGTVLSQSSAMGKLLISTVYVAWSMAGIAALAFMISTMTDSAMGALIGAAGVGLVSQILDAISSLGSIRGWLLTHYWSSWEDLFTRSYSTSDLINGVLLQIPYVLVFLALGWWWFKRRDILT